MFVTPRLSSIDFYFYFVVVRLIILDYLYYNFCFFYSLYLCTLTITYLRRCLDNDIFLRFVEISSGDYTGVLKCLFIYTILVLLSIFDEVTKNVSLCLFYFNDYFFYIYNKNVVVNFLSTVHHPHETIITINA